MDMQGRGWRKEHLVKLRDLATGKEVPVWTGLTPDPNSDTEELIAVFAVDDGPTLRLRDQAGQLRINIRATVDDDANAAEEHRRASR